MKRLERIAARIVGVLSYVVGGWLILSYLDVVLSRPHFHWWNLFVILFGGR